MSKKEQLAQRTIKLKYLQQYNQNLPDSSDATYLSIHFLAQSHASPIMFTAFAIIFLIYFGCRLKISLRQRHNEQLGLDCERAVGQELNHLMLEGCRVYHDFKADNFNIDHIVIGENGVFAIETKGRPKPDRGRGQEDVRVVYDGQTLQFPTWREKEPIDQARRQANWLSGQKLRCHLR